MKRASLWTSKKKIKQVFKIIRKVWFAYCSKIDYGISSETNVIVSGCKL